MSTIGNNYRQGYNGQSTTSPKTPDDWARIWFSKLAKFHNVHDPQRWYFSREDVITFLQERRDKGTPAWKRLKAVQGLIRYRDKFLKSRSPEMDTIQSTLRQISLREKKRGRHDAKLEEQAAASEPASDIEEARPPINPNENDSVRTLRKAVRKNGHSYNTEKCYVKWLKRFMRVRGLKSLVDFGAVKSKDVESFLTDLAVDGGVAASTQDQAFYAMLYF